MQNKILLAIAVVIIISTNADAQIKKGAVLLGGSLGFSTRNNKVSTTQDYRSTSFNVSPALGKAIKENLLLGFDLSYGYAKNEFFSPPVQKTNSYGAGIFIRKYKVLGKGFLIYSIDRDHYDNGGRQRKDAQAGDIAFLCH